MWGERESFLGSVFDRQAPKPPWFEGGVDKSWGCGNPLLPKTRMVFRVPYWFYCFSPMLCANAVLPGYATGRLVPALPQATGRSPAWLALRNNKGKGAVSRFREAGRWPG